MSVIKRRIHFFRLRTRTDDPDVRFSIVDAMRTVESLPFQTAPIGPDSRYLETDDSERLIGLWRYKDDEPVKVMLGSVRSGGLPSTEEQGTINPLDIGKKSLIDLTHCIFFPTGIVGAEFNFHGPRATKLEDYFYHKCGDQPQFALDPITQGDPGKMLSQLSELRLFQLRISPGKIPDEQLASGGLFSFLGDLASQTGADVIDVTLRPKLRSRDSLSKHIGDIAKSLVGWPQIGKVVDVFKVEGISSKTMAAETFDLLRDKFVAEEEVVKSSVKYRSVDSKSMFAAIETAYNRLEKDLQSAIAIGLPV